MDAGSSAVTVHLYQNCRDGVLRDCNPGEGRLEIDYVVFNTAADAAGHCIIDDGVRREDAPISCPVAIIDCVTVSGQKILNLKPVRNFLKRHRPTTTSLFQPSA